MLHSKPISQLVKNVKIVGEGPRDGLWNIEKVYSSPSWAPHLHVNRPLETTEYLLKTSNL